ncbi:MAG: hypothetical protein H7124_12325 [Phycisphaerales bacterium]|nr:hypothetical protein [Hyphomonadaceae bacterium]
MSDVFARPERMLASVAALLLFTLNEARMFNMLPRSPDTAKGQVHGVWLQLMGASEPAYLSAIDLALRWGLAGFVAGLCVWTVAETFKRQPITAD